MKKLLFVALLAALMALATATVASANGGPHGGYAATTDACAGCHRAHTATAPVLVNAATTYTLCMSCHGTAGTGADTNVNDGYFLSTRSTSTEGTANTTDNNPLLGGGFANYKGAATTSTHSVSGASVNAWGTATRGVAGTAMALDCASCHDPHGSTNYRIINTTVNAVAVTVAQVDEGAKDYDTEQWGTGQSNVCAACHTEYHKTAAGQGSVLDNGTYTHRVGMAYTYGANVNPETVGFGGFTLPLAETGTNNTVVCQTCHLPHGTSASMTTLATGPVFAGSNLLRLDNRAVCEVCHQK